MIRNRLTTSILYLSTIYIKIFILQIFYNLVGCECTLEVNIIIYDSVLLFYSVLDYLYLV